MSIRVISGPWHDQMPPRPETPIHILLASDEDAWRGYTFILSYQWGELSNLEINRGRDAQPLGRVALQGVPLGQLDRAARQRIERLLGSRDSEDRPQIAELRAHFPEIEDWWDATADQGTPSKEDVRLAQLAKRYVELGGQKGWRKTLGKELGWSEKSVQTMVSRARTRHLLTKVPRGQYGGQLTPRARIVLGEISRAQVEEWRGVVNSMRRGLEDVIVREQAEGDPRAQQARGLLDEVRKNPLPLLTPLISDLEAGRIDSQTFGRVIGEIQRGDDEVRYERSPDGTYPRFGGRQED